MATNMNLLMGEVIEDPEKQERDVELLLSELLRSLIEEQRILGPHTQLQLQQQEEVK